MSAPPPGEQRGSRLLAGLGSALVAAALGMAIQGCGDIDPPRKAAITSQDLALFVRTQILTVPPTAAPVCLDEITLDITRTGSEFTDLTGCKVP